MTLGEEQLELVLAGLKTEPSSLLVEVHRGRLLAVHAAQSTASLPLM